MSMYMSSPALSAPPSPSPSASSAFHAPVRVYHAARRTSNSSAASPRFAVATVPTYVSTASASAATHTHHPRRLEAHSPQPSKKRYADSSTQYSPAGFPPTYRPPAVEHVAPAPLTAPALASTQRGQSSAAPAATEPPAPPEPQVRVPPAPPVASTQHAPPSGRKTPRESTQPAVQRTPVARDTGATAAAAASATDLTPASPAKRARAQEAGVKVMPLQYETCDVKDLGLLISDMLMELVRINDVRPLQDGTLTRFHSRAPPGISVRDYLTRLIVHATLSPPILLSMVFYVDKLCAMYPAFTISSLTVHRFLITAATVAAKGLSDSFWTNSLYARVGGVSVRELALLELEFLRKLDWRIVPKPEVLVDYYKGLVERGAGYVIESESQATASTSSDPLSRSESATGIPLDRPPA